MMTETPSLVVELTFFTRLTVPVICSSGLVIVFSISSEEAQL